MNVLAELRRRFAAALPNEVTDTAPLLAMVVPSQDRRFGDYQANLAMPLGKLLSRSPREVAGEIVARLDLADLCHPPQIAGPGFINLRLRDEWLAEQLTAMLPDPRLQVPPEVPSRTYVVDYSAPNVAKPMHVGHIRSTVIGDSLYRTLRFLGHRVISDNHIGDWGTQFGMVIYGYKHLRDEAAYERDPVTELARLYRLVNQLVDYEQSRAALPALETQVAQQQELVEAAQSAASRTGDSAAADAKAQKAARKDARKLETRLADLIAQRAATQARIAAVESDPHLSELARRHEGIGKAVLGETARLHAGDAENLALWRAFLPACLADIERTYRRLGVSFDHTLGESFYHDRLAEVVDDFRRRGLARESEGAVAVFLPGFETPMLIQKQDGAYLYATTDLATIRYRVQQWQPDTILYVVDFRQSLHFEQLFAAAREWGYDNLELVHVSFGTVLGDDGRPFRTRAGDTVGLSALLDEAVERAYTVVSENDDAKPAGPELSEPQRREIAEAVGIAALKYADLSQNRTSDYVFSYDKMLAMNGNTATYMQYAYARVHGIFAKGQVDPESLRGAGAAVRLDAPQERELALELLRFAEALEQVVADWRPNQLTAYLFELANAYSRFFENCPVLRADDPQQRTSRLRLCDLTARTLRQGLALLGIEVVEKM